MDVALITHQLVSFMLHYVSCTQSRYKLFVARRAKLRENAEGKMKHLCDQSVTTSTVRNVQVLHLYVQAHNCEAVILSFCFLLYKLVSVCRQRGSIDGSVILKQAPRNSSRALKSIGHSGQTVSLQHRVMHTASKLFSRYSLYFFLSITTHKVDPLQSKNN